MNNIGIVISGGIGNQLFKIFAALSYYIDNSNSYKLYATGDIGYRQYYWDTLFSNISHKVSNTIDINEKYSEPHFHYKVIPIFNKDTILEGYFQSYKYFEKNINKIRRIIGLDEHINKVLIKHPEYTIDNTITLHYRMGDYYNLQLFHPVQKPEYYIEAFKTLMNKGVDIYAHEILYFCEKNDNVVVNDYNAVINNALKELYGKELKYKKVSDDIPDWQQLLIMTSSKHYIIGNSTFSWFGAYLSSSAAPVICYPNTWFGQNYEGTNTADLFPKNWTRIGGC